MIALKATLPDAYALGFSAAAASDAAEGCVEAEGLVEGWAEVEGWALASPEAVVLSAAPVAVWREHEDDEDGGGGSKETPRHSGHIHTCRRRQW